MKSQQSGFTLVEIAIVLVIIGLLLGGILKGQELINSAKAKSLANDFRNTPIYIYGYQDKFRSIPGDDAQAASHVSLTPAATPGNGNGKIEGNWDSSTTTDESVMFWQHVRAAGLAAGDTILGQGLPNNADGARIGVSGLKPITDTDFNGTYYMCSRNIKGKFAKMIDVQLDDGHTDKGSVRAVPTPTTIPAGGATPAASVGETAAGWSDDTLYDVCMAF